jgi:hypothetical protein
MKAARAFPHRAAAIRAILDDTHGAARFRQRGFHDGGPARLERQMPARYGDDSPRQRIRISQDVLQGGPIQCLVGTGTSE